MKTLNLFLINFISTLLFANFLCNQVKYTILFNFIFMYLYTEKEKEKKIYNLVNVNLTKFVTLNKTIFIV